MRFRACIALLLLLSACAPSTPSPAGSATPSPKVANLLKAAELPWRDEGRCVVQEASHPWPVMVERCFQALDHDRIRFHDSTGRCTVASAGAAALGLGVCILAAPEILVGAVIVTGVVVVAVAIKEALDAARLRERYPEETMPAAGTKVAPLEPLVKRSPKSKPSGQDWLPPVPPPERMERERRPECRPQRVPHLGGSDPHNTCADRVPQNNFSGWDVLVNGKNFDALQLATRTPWEIKTDNFDTYSPFLQRRVVEKQLPGLQHERAVAQSCGFDFKVGVRSAAHRDALLDLDRSLEVIVMDWC